MSVCANDTCLPLDAWCSITWCQQQQYDLSRDLLILVVFHHPGCAVGQRPPQVGVPLWMPSQHVLLLQWVWLVLWSSACLQGRRETTSTLPGGLFLLYRGSGPGQTKDFEDRAVSFCRRSGPPARARTKVASLEQQSASKAGECSFSLKLTIFPKFIW